MPTPDLDEQARARVRQLVALYVHLAAYAVVIVMLFGINASGTDAEQGNWWVVYPALGWGAAVAAHVVLVATGGFGSWQERKVEALVQRRRRQG